MSSLSNETLYFVLPLRDIVVFPHSDVPLFVAREKSIKTLQTIITPEMAPGLILLVTQKQSKTDEPTFNDLYQVGTLARIKQFTELPGGGVKLLAEGLQRIQLVRPVENHDHLQCFGTSLPTVITDNKELEATRRLLMQDLTKYLKSVKKKSLDPYPSIMDLEDTEIMADLLSSNFDMSVSLKQEILSAVSLEDRLRILLTYLATEIEVSNVETRILSRIKENVKKHQDEYVKQIKNQAIREELGNDNESDSLELRIKNAKLPPEARKKTDSELKKLRCMNPMSPEAVVIRHYLEWIADLPWGKKTPLEKNLDVAEQVLNKDHYALSDVKSKIKEYLAVYNRTGQTQGTVLCFVGPPGVGKTSIGKSIARATKRKFARIALGGVRDEAEIRGHRRTYVGSMPGKIIQELKRCGSSNPLFLFDEIDKIGQDWKGDPASALLEVLDPEQNNNFGDHYLEVPFPLNDCMFICTANSVQNIPPALLDRMEVISLSSYTEDEKTEIAKQHLVPNQKSKNGIKDDEFTISEEAIRKLIRGYTRESGVRNLDREIGSLSRKAVTMIDSKKIDRLAITKANLEKYAGVSRYTHGEVSESDAVGVSTGLAWTEVGGELLLIEAVLVPGRGKVIATGKLGEVMKESVQTAFSFLRSQAIPLNIDLTLLETRDIHVHVPEAATPKDGPSAGIAIYLAMLSVLLKKPIKSTTAVTGEISLSGKVWPIGGLKEKVLAAHRGGIKVVLIPSGNVKDLENIPDNVKAALSIIPIAYANEAHTYAFDGLAALDDMKSDTTIAAPTISDDLIAKPKPTTEDLPVKKVPKVTA